MQALILAAGMGKRLGKYTSDNTKCMVEVAGAKLIDRQLKSILAADIKKVIIVVGYKAQNLISYINKTWQNKEGLSISFVENKDYEKTNNIYSLFLAKELAIKDDTILMESDIVFEEGLIKKIKETHFQNVCAIAKYEIYMDGTLVTVNANNFITDFIPKNEINFSNIENFFKTVNVYKFNKTFLKDIYFPFLETYMKVYGVNCFYETILRVTSNLDKNNIYGLDIKDTKWYEIDDAQDLDIANVIFSTGKTKYDLIMSKFGGYWRYPQINDFCYLVNPYFPTKSFIQKLNYKFGSLISSYPSGLDTQNLNAERIFNVDKNFILVGNGAAELINCLGRTFCGKVAVGVPTFNEYKRCFSNHEIEIIDNSKCDFNFNLQDYKSYCKTVNLLCIVSPDNPSGAMLSEEDLIDLCECAKKTNTNILIDESFVDFASRDKKFTLLKNEILQKYPNLIVVKSIGKSYGVAGLRLGVMATSNEDLLQKIRQNLAVWNINSIAEFYLQNYNAYEKDYKIACEKIVKEREFLTLELSKINKVKVYPSEANFIMINLLNYSSYDFCTKALDEFNLLIKDLSKKDCFKNKNYVRVAVKDHSDNLKLIKCFKSILKGV